MKFLFSVLSLAVLFAVLLSEYVIATGDESVMPGLRRLALKAAKGQSAVGSWVGGYSVYFHYPNTWLRETGARLPTKVNAVRQ